MSGQYPGLDRISVEEVRARARGIVSGIDAILAERERLRDELIKSGRDIIRLSGWAINALHRGRLDEAKKHVDEMKKLAEDFMSRARSDSFLWHSGFTNNVLSEYAEALIFYSIVVKGELPAPEDIGIPEVPYLQGLGDTLGELRRLALDLMRVGDLVRAEKLLDIMEALYYELRVLEYPDALMPGVRHKIDVARRLLDDTKALLLTVKARLG